MAEHGDRLAGLLRDAAREAAVRARPVGLAAVAAGGRQRRRRRLAAMAGTATVCTAAVVAFAVAGAAGGREGVPPASPDGVPTAPPWSGTPSPPEVPGVGDHLPGGMGDAGVELGDVVEVPVRRG
ncbi:hypothetical protein AB0E16_28830, partial [Streptomyces sp. NPDC047970]